MLPKPKPLILEQEEAQTNMRWIYISPHFDDAVLSCGGLIWEQTHSGIAVEIWTICAGDPPAGPTSDFIEKLHKQWNTGTSSETVALRRVEDKSAALRVGATPHHFSVPDAIYRRSDSGDLFYTEDIFTPIDPKDEGVVGQIADALAQKLTNYDTVVCPLALGGHVDHVITRMATEKLGRPLWYYADIPYFMRYPEQLEKVSSAMTAKTFFVSSRGLTAWQDGIACYESQISSLFADKTDMRQQIREYLRDHEGLRLWEVE